MAREHVQTRELGRVGRAGLAQDALAVVLDRPRRERQLGRDLLRREACGEQPADLVLAPGQRREAPPDLAELRARRVLRQRGVDALHELSRDGRPLHEVERPPAAAPRPRPEPCPGR
jgi:hypothetical protein